jgi:hypothetical protein
MQCGEQGFFPHFVILKKLANFLKKISKISWIYIKNPKKALEENLSGFGGHYIGMNLGTSSSPVLELPKCEADPLATTSS